MAGKEEQEHGGSIAYVYLPARIGLIKSEIHGVLMQECRKTIRKVGAGDACNQMLTGDASVGAVHKTNSGPWGRGDTRQKGTKSINGSTNPLRRHAGQDQAERNATLFVEDMRARF